MKAKKFQHKNIAITALSFPHAVSPKTPTGTRLRFRKEFPNYGYLVEVNGWKILHIGDGDFSPSIIDGLKLAEVDIDVALLPSWIPEEEGGMALIERYSACRHAQGMWKWVRWTLGLDSGQPAWLGVSTDGEILGLAPDESEIGNIRSTRSDIDCLVQFGKYQMLFKEIKRFYQPRFGGNSACCRRLYAAVPWSA